MTDFKELVDGFRAERIAHDDRFDSFIKEAPRGLSEHPPVTPAGIVPEGGPLPPTPETTAPIEYTSNDPFDAHRRAYYDHVREVLGSTASDDVIEGIAPYTMEWNRPKEKTFYARTSDDGSDL